VEKAKRWFNRAVTFAPDVGDIWAWFYRFLLEHGTESDREEIKRKCAQANPTHGEYWRYISRSRENQKKSTEERLELTSSLLQSPGAFDPGPYSPHNAKKVENGEVRKMHEEKIKVENGGDRNEFK
jgi:predicted Zn-dependent protease